MFLRHILLVFLILAVPCFFSVSSREMPRFNYAGAGIWGRTNEYKGVDARSYFVPIVNAEYKRFFLDIDRAGFFLITDEGKRNILSLVARPRFMGYDADESYMLNGTHDRRNSIDAGFSFLSRENGIADFKITALTDTMGRHDGQEVSVFLSRELLKGFLVPRIGTCWYSAKLTGYYYGVDESETSSGFNVYSPGSSAVYCAGIMMRVPLKNNWLAVFDINFNKLASRISDSPLVEKDDLFGYTAGVIYRF